MKKRVTVSIGLALAALLIAIGFLESIAVRAQGPQPRAFTDPRPLRARTAGLGEPEPAGLGVMAANPVETFWVYDFYAGLDRLITATLGYTSARAYIYVDSAETVSVATVSGAAANFDSIYNTTTGYFGDVPNVDGEARIFVLLTNIRDVYYNDPDATSYVACFFDPLHQYPSEPNSNGREMLFLDLNPADPLGDEANRCLARQLELMIGFNYDPYEEFWFDEGLGSLAEYINGYGHRPEIQDYLNYPERPLTGWTGNEMDVGESYLWALYIRDRYGQAGVRAVVQSGQQGMNAIQPALGISPTALFHRWALANYLDDETQAGGIYGYNSIEITSTPGAADGVTIFNRPAPISYAIQEDEWVITGTMPAYWGARYYELNRPAGFPILKIGDGKNFQGQSLIVNGRVSHFNWTMEAEVSPFAPADRAVLAVLPARSTGLFDYEYKGAGVPRYYLPIIFKNY